jgi:hypothetical protein
MKNLVAKTRSVREKIEFTSFCLAFIVFLAGTFTLIGYWIDSEHLYRPLVDGPATNPLTAQCYLMSGIYVLMDASKYTDHPLKLLFMLAVFLAALFKIIDYLTGSNIAEVVIPFYFQVKSELESGKSNIMALNTGVMFFAFTLAIFAKQINKYLLTLLFSTIAFTIAAVSVLGYLYELEEFYGQMSLLTAVLGLLLALSVLAPTLVTVWYDRS